MNQKFLLLVMMLATWSDFSIMWAQSTPTPPDDSGTASQDHTAPVPALAGGYLLPEGQEGDSDTDAGWSTLRPIVPAMVGGYGSSLAFGEEMERSNYIRGGLTAQSTYDDNPYGTDSSMNSSATNYSVSIFPQISLDQSRSRIRWLLNYAGGFTFNQKLAQQNQTSQNFNFDLQYRVSPHVNVRATEVISLTTGLFGAVNTLNGSAPGVPEGSNTFVLTPLAKQFATVTRGEIGYQFAQTDIVGASGGFNSLNYRDVSQDNVLLDTQAENVSGYYMHRLTPTNWLGTAYSFEHLGYPGNVDNTVVHSVIGFDTYAPKPSITLSFFGGPQYSDNRFPTNAIPPQVVSESMWSVAGGAGFGWTAPRTSVNVGYAYRIADGGGLQSSVQVNSVSGSLHRQLTDRLSMSFLGSYASNDALAPSALGATSSKYASGGISFTQRLGRNCFVQAGYTRQSQQTTGLTSVGGDVHRDVVMASFSYQFSKPWGQ